LLKKQKCPSVWTLSQEGSVPSAPTPSYMAFSSRLVPIFPFYRRLCLPANSSIESRVGPRSPTRNPYRRQKSVARALRASRTKRLTQGTKNPIAHAQGAEDCIASARRYPLTAARIARARAATVATTPRMASTLLLELWVPTLRPRLPAKQSICRPMMPTSAL